MKNKIILLLLGAIVLVVGLMVIVFINIPSSNNEEDENNSEQESITNIETIDFAFPQSLGTTYISTVDWPPVVRVEEDVYNCTEAGEETARAGQTEEQFINGHTYCVTVVSEGAAGSVYRMYSYNFVYHEQNVFVTFSLRFPQCANYPEEERLSCQEEQDSFEPGELVDQTITNRLEGS